MSLRCVIVDDNPGVLEAASKLLSSQGLEVVAAVASAQQALRSMDQLRPDVMLIDIDLGDESGLALARRVADLDSGSGTRCILISTHDERDYADLIAETPVAGFLPKSELSGRGVRLLLGIEDAHGVIEHRDR